MSDDQFRAPAGWYPDPLGLPQLRWWNNHGWTEQVSAAPEPVIVQEPRLAWKEEERPVQEAPAAYRAPTPPQPKVSSSLNELEGPRATNQVSESAGFDDWQANFVPSATAQPAPAPTAAAAPAAAPAATPTPTPPAYWDADDDSLPTPSIRPEDLKFWPGTSPAELRRAAREQAARE